MFHRRELSVVTLFFKLIRRNLQEVFYEQRKNIIFVL